MKILIVILLFHICLLPKMLCAQDKDLHWFTLSAGLGGAEVAGSVDYHWVPANKKISIGVHTFFSEQILSVAKVNTAAATVGIHRNRRYGFMSASAGFGPVWGIKQGEYIGGALFSWGRHQEIPFTTIGIPIQAEFRFDPVKFAGAGLAIAANVNPKYTYLACMLTLSLGRLKT